MAALGWMLNLDFAGGAAAVVQTIFYHTEEYGPSLRCYIIGWTANQDGDASLWLDGTHAALLEGTIHRVETQPSAVKAPTANYDIALQNRTGADILGGVCTNRSSTASEWAWPYHALGTSGHGERATIRCLEFVVANAGAGGGGTCAFYLVD